jgi:hypothetical protein
MEALVTYICTRTVLHDGARHEHGAPIHLTEAAAARLLELDAIRPTAEGDPLHSVPVELVEPASEAPAEGAATVALSETGETIAPFEAVAAEADEQIESAIRALPPEAFTSGGLPKVDAIEAQLRQGGVELKVSAADRDRLWAAMQPDT